MNWTKIALVLLSLLLYAFFLERLGFVLTTFVLVSFLLGCVEGTNWFRSLGVAVRGGAGELCDVRAMAKDQAPQRVSSVFDSWKGEHKMTPLRTRNNSAGAWFWSQAIALGVRRQLYSGRRISTLQGRLKWSWHFPPAVLPT